VRPRLAEIWTFGLAGGCTQVKGCNKRRTAECAVPRSNEHASSLSSRKKGFTLGVLNPPLQRGESAIQSVHFKIPTQDKIFIFHTISSELPSVSSSDSHGRTTHSPLQRGIEHQPAEDSLRPDCSTWSVATTPIPFGVAAVSMLTGQLDPGTEYEIGDFWQAAPSGQLELVESIKAVRPRKE
jgi:hypothetical protein